MAARKTMKMPVVALLMAAVLVVVVVAEQGGNGWQESVNSAAGGVKEKAEDAMEGAKSWTDWAVGKFSEQFNDEKKEDSPSTTQKLGEAKEKVIKMAADTHGKANEAYESAKGSVSGQAKASYEAAKEKATDGAHKAGLPGHNEL